MVDVVVFVVFVVVVVVVVVIVAVADVVCFTFYKNEEFLIGNRFYR